MGDAIMSGNLAEGFVMLTDTAHHVWPFFCWYALVRLTWTWMLLSGDDRGNTAKQLLQGKQVLKELALRGHKVN
ncbi:MAG: hypothetical protein AUH05_15565 [Ktedonobacter sp. 13_2_20CM_53_11]|jgi:hypothetical protein|nr:MAG: hypothetical protein AUH05_15565 [Ktedonobacter sp. 13_2_20CM_53_11]